MDQVICQAATLPPGNVHTTGKEYTENHFNCSANEKSALQLPITTAGSLKS